MSFDLEHRLRAFLASAPQKIYSIQVIQFGHPAMTRGYTLWREPYDGYIRDETGVIHAVQGVNMQITATEYEGNLDQALQVSIDTTDADDVIRGELDRIPVDTAERIIVRYWEFLSDDLESPVLSARLQAESINYEKGVATITAISPRFSVTRTGELYDTRTIPMMRSFL